MDIFINRNLLTSIIKVISIKHLSHLFIKVKKKKFIQISFYKINNQKNRIIERCSSLRLDLMNFNASVN
jgi:hypothetical protein